MLFRSRPKAMTVSAMALGLGPIMWSTGTGADVMKRIAAPLIGGIFASFVLELLVYPAVYEVWKWHFDIKPALAGPASPVLTFSESPYPAERMRFPLGSGGDQEEFKKPSLARNNLSSIFNLAPGDSSNFGPPGQPRMAIFRDGQEVEKWNCSNGSGEGTPPER